jgi:adenine-specific DNA methylase
MDALDRLETIERNKAVEDVMRKHGFTEADLTYGEVDGEQQLLLSRKAFTYIESHDFIQEEMRKAISAATIKALETGMTIIKLQKIGGIL